MKKVCILIAATAAAAAQPAVAQDLLYSNDATESCLQEAVGDAERLDCIGASANQCMTATPGGGSTVGTGGCLSRELTYWDARLNDVYGQLVAQHADEPLIATRLREMQRAWISFRDARCDYEFVQWGGGTGGGPALTACLMQTTGAQTQLLEQNLR